MGKISSEKLKDTIESLEKNNTFCDPVIFGNLIDNLIEMSYCTEYTEMKKRVEALLVREVKRMAEPTNSEKVIQLLAAEEMELLNRVGDDELTLSIIPHNTSTKVAVFKGTGLLLKEDIPLPVQQNTDADFRVNQIRTFLSNHKISLEMVSGIAVKGGYLQPAEGGTFLVDEEMLKDTLNSKLEHPSNLGIIIGTRLRARKSEILLTTTDPVSTDEMTDSERILGISGYLRSGSGAHYLNHRSIAKLLSGIMGKRYEDSVFITTHAGGGISTVRHQHGRITSVMNTFSDMPGSNRAGNLPIELIVEEIKSGRISIEELKRFIYNEGGLLHLTGTNDFKTLLNFRDMGSSEVQRQKINMILGFFTKVIARSIMSVSIERGLPLTIAISGGLSRSEEIMRLISELINVNVPLIPFSEIFDLELLAVENMLSRVNPERLKDYSKEKLIYSRKIASIKKILDTKLFDSPVFRVKPQMPARCINDIIFMAKEQAVKYGCPRIGIVGANNEEAIEAANLANSEGRFRIAKFLLIGPFAEISKMAWEYDVLIDNDNFTIIDAEEPVLKAMSLYKNGVINMLMKGSVMTEQIMRSFIETTKSMLSSGEKVFLSHVGVFEVPAYPKLLLISDAAINPSPNKEAKKKIIYNTIAVAKALNIKHPKIAIISAVEKVNPSVLSSVEAKEIADELSGTDDFVIEGPLSVDVAINPRIAEEKKYRGKILGDADILIMPDIEAGNIIYKTLTVSSHAKIAGVVVGGKVPLILTSRGDTSLSKLASISLGILLYTLTNISKS
ncbi:MAG: phosphate acyltransferase [Deltaproteobacteria bacterium]|nr:phosphate acyltransferase [Deltaproteobacteria bacterium]